MYDKDGNKVHVHDGEVALSLSMMDKANLEVGDSLIIQQNGIEKELKILEPIKDAAFGNEMVGMIRFMLSENDYRAFASETQGIGLYYINTDLANFSEDMNNQGFIGIMNTISIDMYKLIYSFDMIMAGLLILIGICLILIALLVLRFTLVFSLEEQYQEIGILKAIGLRNLAIKKLYLMKYSKTPT